MFTLNNEMWDIVLVPPHDIELLMPNGNYAVGACNDEVKTIFINNQIYGEDYEKVLCHELTHAAMFAYDIFLTEYEEELLANLMPILGEEIINATDRLKKGRY